MNSCGFYSLLCSLLLLIGVASKAVADPADRQHYLQQIESAALQYLTDHLQQRYPEDKIDIKMSVPDPRIDLPRCDQPLSYAPHGNAYNTSTVTVKASCEGSQRWAFYLRAQVDYWRQVAVASRSIHRGEMIEETDVKAEFRQLTRTGLSTHLLVEEAVGLLAKRAIAAGDTIRSTHVEAPLAVKRGDRVKILSRNALVSIEATGEALSNGSLGDQIRVKNLSSERVVKARIIAPGETEVLL